MGVVFRSLTAPDKIIQRIQDNPPLIWKWYSPDDAKLYLSAIGAGEKPSFTSRLFGTKALPVPDALPTFSFADGERNKTELGKSWDGINFYLKKIVPKDCPNLFEDGQPVGDVEVGYGPAMSFIAMKSYQFPSLRKNYKCNVVEGLRTRCNEQRLSQGVLEGKSARYERVPFGQR